MENYILDFGSDYDEIVEPPKAPNGRYQLRIDDVKYVADEKKPNYLFTVRIVNGDYAPIFHRTYIPTSEDDADKRKYKILFAKRFLTLFNIPVTNGKFDPQSAVGREATASVTLRTYTAEDGTESVQNSIVLPPVEGKR